MRWSLFFWVHSILIVTHSLHPRSARITWMSVIISFTKCTTLKLEKSDVYHHVWQSSKHTFTLSYVLFLALNGCTFCGSRSDNCIHKLVHSLDLNWQNLIVACLFHNMPELLERRSLWTLHGCSLPYSSWFTFSWDHLTELTVCESLWLCRWLWSLSSKWNNGLKDPVMFLVLCNQWSSCFRGRSIFGGSGEVRETREGINYTANLQLSCMILR